MLRGLQRLDHSRNPLNIKTGSTDKLHCLSNQRQVRRRTDFNTKADSWPSRVAYWQLPSCLPLSSLPSPKARTVSQCAARKHCNKAQTFGHDLALNVVELKQIASAISHDLTIVVTYGGTISCQNEDGILVPSDKTLQRHNKHGSFVVQKAPLDSSQITKGEIQTIVTSVKTIVESGGKQICLEFGTDSAGYLVNALLLEIGDLIKRSECKILIATSMTAGDRGGEKTRRIYDVQKRQAPATVALFSATTKEDQIIEIDPCIRKKVYKVGNKNRPFIVKEAGQAVPLHTELQMLQKRGYRLIFSSPDVSCEDVVDQIERYSQEKIVLTGLGDFNFFCHDDVLRAIKKARLRQNRLYLSTTFSGSFKEPEPTPYLPRSRLLEAGCILLHEAKAQKILSN